MISSLICNHLKLSLLWTLEMLNLQSMWVSKSLVWGFSHLRFKWTLFQGYHHWNSVKTFSFNNGIYLLIDYIAKKYIYVIMSIIN